MREDETGAPTIVQPAAAVWRVSILVAGDLGNGWDLFCHTWEVAVNHVLWRVKYYVGGNSNNSVTGRDN